MVSRALFVKNLRFDRHHAFESDLLNYKSIFGITRIAVTM